MNPLRSAHKVRVQLAIRSALQLSIAFGLFVAAMASGAHSGILGLIVCLFGAAAFVFYGIRNFREYQRLGAHSKAQKVLRREIGTLRKAGWVQARQRKLPPSCRGAVVMFTEEGDLAFVIGLSGYWPVRESLAEPQKVASTLERFGVPHIPVCLAAFVTGAEESFNYGVLAVSPSRFHTALGEAVESFRERQDRAFTGMVDRVHSHDAGLGEEVIA